MPDTAPTDAPDRAALPERSYPTVGETGRRALGADVRTERLPAEDGGGLRSTFTFMTGDLARDGMIVDPAGVDVTNYLRNPVVLWEHGWDLNRGGVPVGRATAVRRVENGWAADVEWEEDEFAQRIAGMVQRGTLSAVSFGWRTLAREWRDLDGREVMVVTRAEMMEFSVVSVPADAGALVTERAEGAVFSRVLDALRDQSETINALRSEIAEVRTQAPPTPAEAEVIAQLRDVVAAHFAAEGLTAPDADGIRWVEVPPGDIRISNGIDTVTVTDGALLTQTETDDAGAPPEAEAPAEEAAPVDPTPAEAAAPAPEAEPEAPRAATPEETAAAVLALLPQIRQAHHRALGRA